MEIVEQQPEILEIEAKEKTPGRFRRAFTKRRKMMILAGMFVLLIVTGYLNFALNNNTSAVDGRPPQRPQLTAVEMARQNNTAARAADELMLMNLINNPNTSEDARRDAEKAKITMQEVSQFETMSEGLIRAIGDFGDVLVAKSGDNINVLVENPENISDTQATQIKLILREVANRFIDIDYIVISILD